MLKVNRFVHKPGYQDWYFLLGLVFTVYLVLRAVLIPITIDEARTYYNYMPGSVSDIFLYNGDPSPNNHILNTLAMKLFTALFGASTFVLRLPNLLGFLLFYTAALRLFRLLLHKEWMIFAALLIILANPYMLDFFALARGYGLSIAFMVWSIYQFYQYYSDKQSIYGVYSLIAAGLAVLSSFTLIHFFALLSSSLLLLEITRKPAINRWKYVMVYTGIILVISGLCFTPLTKIMATNQLVYWNSDGFYTATLLPLIDAMRYGKLYFGITSIEPFANLFIGLFILTLLSSLFIWLKKSPSLQLPFSSWLLFIILAEVIIIFIQSYLLHVPFLNARGAIFFYPIFMLCIIANIAECTMYRIYWPQKLMALLAIAGFIHLGRTVNISSAREWWFDAYTKEVLEWINQQHPGKEHVSLNSSWIFNNSLHFHKDVQHFYNLDIAPYHQDIAADADYLYYYCQREEVPKLNSAYTEVHSFNFGYFVIMKKKD